MDNNVNRIKVCHLTSAHDNNDIRIFLKECSSLSSSGYDVYLVAQGSNRNENGVHVIGVGECPNGRYERMRKFSRKVYDKACELNCDIYHFHDPELLLYGLKLKRRGKTVIFDSHEDVAAQIIDKQWIPILFRRPIAFIYSLIETYVSNRIDAVIAATKHIADTFINRAKIVVVVNNYPKLDDIVFQEMPFVDRERIIAYAGGISEVRGKSVMIEAMKTVNGDLCIACDHAVEDAGNIHYLGNKTRDGVNELYKNSRMGIVIYQPAGNHYDSQPIKLFEFMAAGLPVVASNFPLWKQIVEDNNCGICVDPCCPKDVSKACNTLLSNPEIAERMGRNGRLAVENNYSWNGEEKKLLALYEGLS